MKETSTQAGDASVGAEAVRHHWLHRNPFTLAALVVAFVALSLAALFPALLSPPEIKGGIWGLVKSAVRSEKDPAQIAFEMRLRQAHLASLVAGIAAAALGVTGLVRREKRIMATSALVVATIAVLWEYLIIALIVAIVIGLILSLVDI
jgi:hypothetical protein